MGPNAHPLLASDMYKNMTALAGLTFWPLPFYFEVLGAT